MNTTSSSTIRDHHHHPHHQHQTSTPSSSTPSSSHHHHPHNHHHQHLPAVRRYDTSFQMDRSGLSAGFPEQYVEGILARVVAVSRGNGFHELATTSSSSSQSQVVIKKSLQPIRGSKSTALRYLC
jgi:hypothetical protein